jgi:hypothetical protein
MAKTKAKEAKIKDTKESEIHWLAYVEELSYPAAQSYLSLLFPKERVDAVIAGLRAASVVRFQGKDIFRASRLSLQGVSHSHVERERKRITRGEGLSPLLLLRDEAQGSVVVAAGYHRLCAVYGFDEDVWVPCKIV